MRYGPATSSHLERTSVGFPAVEYVGVVMRRKNLANIPAHPLPAGFAIRTFRAGDEVEWARIECAAGEFKTTSRAMAHFQSEFGGFEKDLAKRCLFLETGDGRAIGTVTAWWGTVAGREPADAEWDDRVLGRLHWIGIVPSYQGRGLSKPLVEAAMRVLAAWHDRAYLTTQTTSAVAVKVYLDLGFRPWVISEEQHRGWQLLASYLKHPALGDIDVT